MTEPRSAARPPSARPAKKGLFRRIGDATRPARRTRRTIGTFAALLALALGAYLGAGKLGSEWGTWADAGIGAGVVVVFLLVIPLVVALAGWLLRWLPSVFGQLGIAALAACLFIFTQTGVGRELSWVLAGGGLVATAMVFGALAILTGGQFKTAGFMKKAWVLFCLIGGLGAVGYGSWWQWWDQQNAEHLVAAAGLERGTPPPASTAADPGKPGTFEVDTLTYGSGTDRHRPEFGTDAKLKTEPVNGRPFVTFPKGWRGELREAYWGFGAGALPLNGRVWFPKGDGPFPLVLVVHGNHTMTEFSDPGYEYLGTHLASRGIITCSVDENFLNGGGFLYQGTSKENDCRAWVLLQHLKTWRAWNAAASGSNPFAGKVAMDKIGLIGHSRGGEAVCHAALFNRLPYYPDDASVAFDFGFGIQAVVAIAPVDHQYLPAGRFTAMRDVSFLTIQGGHDADVSSFAGDRLFERLRFSAGSTHFKASLFVYQANHGQFNSVWGGSDWGEPKSWFLNRAALLKADEQRQIARVFIGGFLAATLQGQRDYVALLRDHRVGRAWLPDTLMATRYEDASWRTLCDFEEDFDGSTTTLEGGRIEASGFAVRREGDIKLRGTDRRNTGLFLGWDRTATTGDAAAVEASAKKDGSTPAALAPPASLRLTLPKPLGEVWPGAQPGALVFAAAASDGKPKAKDYSGAKDDKEGSAAGEEEGAGAKAADAKARTLDFTVVLVAQDGAEARLPLSTFGTVLPPLKSRFTSSPLLEKERKAFEPVLQGFALPLAAFAKANDKFDPARLVEVRFEFDRTDKGFLIFDAIGFAAAGD